MDPIFKRKHPSSGENTPLPPAARNSRHSMALALRASFAVRRRVLRLQSPARGEGRFWGNSSQAGSDHAGRMPAAVGPLRCGAWWRISPQGGRQDVGHRFVGTGMCRRNGPTPCADFQHMDVLKAQSLGCPSFWFRLSWTSKKDEPVRFSGRNALLWVCSGSLRSHMRETPHGPIESNTDSLGEGCTRAILGPRPAGGCAVLIGYPADQSNPAVLIPLSPPHTQKAPRGAFCVCGGERGIRTLDQAFDPILP